MGKGSKEQVNRRQYETDYSYLHGINGIQPHGLCAETRYPYTDADLDWRDKQSRSSVEMKDKNSRPAITDKLKNMQDYDVVYVGFPIWWYTAPTIINTFMESYDFKGKTVLLNCLTNIAKSIL